MQFEYSVRMDICCKIEYNINKVVELIIKENFYYLMLYLFEFQIK